MVFTKSAKNTLKKIFRAHAQNSSIDFDDALTFSHRQLATLALIEKIMPVAIYRWVHRCLLFKQNVNRRFEI